VEKKIQTGWYGQGKLSRFTGNAAHARENSRVFDRSMQHHLINVSFRDGVYDARRMVKTFA